MDIRDIKKIPDYRWHQSLMVMMKDYVRQIQIILVHFKAIAALFFIPYGRPVWGPSFPTYLK